MIKIKWMMMLLCVELCSFADEPTDALRLDQAYEKRLAALEAGHELAVLRIVNLYVDRLDQLDAWARQRGNLDLVAEIREERVRVRRDKSGPDQASSHQLLANLQNVLVRELAKRDVARAESLLEWVEGYDQALDQLQRERVQADQIEAALNIRDQRMALQNREDVAAARARIEIPVEEIRLSGHRPRQVPEDAVEIQGRFFLLVKEKRTWEEARAYCREQGGDLARVDSPEVNAALEEMRKAQRVSRVFVGLSDEQEEGVWVYSDGTKAEYLNWRGAEPNNAGGNEHVAVMMRGGGWNDMPGGMSFPFFCEW